MGTLRASLFGAAAALVCAVACGDDEAPSVSRDGGTGGVASGGKTGIGGRRTGGAPGSGGDMDTGGSVADSGTDADSGTGGNSCEAVGNWAPDRDGCRGDLCLLKDLRTTRTDGSSASSRRRPFAELGGVVYYAGRDAAHGSELFTLDASSSRATLVKDLTPGLDGRDLDSLGATKSSLFFASRDTLSAATVWRSDGSADGTVPLGSGSHGNVAGDAYFFTSFVEDAAQGPRTLFTVRDGSGDVVEAGTISQPTDTFVSGTRYTFFGSASTGLFRVDEAGKKTVRLHELAVNPGNVFRLGDSVYFFSDGWFYRVDEGVPEAKQAALLAPGTTVKAVYTFQDRGFFQWGETRYDLWATDGTDGGTDKVAEVGGLIVGWAATGTRAFFVVLALSGSIELWRTDGTTLGTGKVGELDGTPRSMTVRGDAAYLIVRGELLSYSEGSGLVSLTEGRAAPASELFAATDGVYFSAQTPEHGMEPWITDGTPAGTREAADVNTATSSAPSGAIALPDGAAVIVARDDSSDTPALWFTDGTDSGTRVLSKPADPVDAFDELFAASRETLVYHTVGTPDVTG